MTDEERARAIANRYARREGEYHNMVAEILAAFAAVREECAKAIEKEHRMGDRDGWLELADRIRTGQARPSDGEG